MTAPLVAPLTAQAVAQQPTHETDLDVASLVLDVSNKQVRGLDRQVAESILDGTLSRTIDGASTLTITVHDPRRVLLRSGMFSYAIDARLDRLFWRLVKVGKQDDDLTLTFEDREVSYLRQHFSPKKASRSKVTRAEFALSLVREVREERIPFICPQLHLRQQVVGIESKRQQRSPASRAVNRQSGISRDAHVTIGGAVADASQLRLAERVLDVADSVGADDRCTLALIEACIVESRMRNLSYGDADSRGVLQVRDSTARGMGINNRDPAQCANAFLRRGFYNDPKLGGGGAIAIADRHPEITAGRLAQAVQGSAYPDRYQQSQSEAQALMEAYSGSGGSSGSLDSTQTRKLPYQFRRGTADGARENSWTCLQRLAQEVNWRCFMSAGSLYFIAESELIKAKPRLILSEDTPGVLGLDFDVDAGKALHEVRVTARANRWLAAPGAVVQLRDCGVADGRWLVATIERGLFDATATITLRRPSKPLLEPAPETTTVTTTGGSSLRSIGLAGSQIERAYQAARAIDAKRYPYVWGGGHGSAGSPSGGGYDCSGSTSAVLAAAGMGLRLGGPALTSGAFASSWGAAGEGVSLTVWANAVHVFMVFHTASGDEHFGTGDWGKSWGGAGFNPNMHPTSGFTPRHWPGT